MSLHRTLLQKRAFAIPGALKSTAGGALIGGAVGAGGGALMGGEGHRMEGAAMGGAAGAALGGLAGGASHHMDFAPAATALHEVAPAESAGAAAMEAGLHQQAPAASALEEAVHAAPAAAPAAPAAAPAASALEEAVHAAPAAAPAAPAAAPAASALEEAVHSARPSDPSHAIFPGSPDHPTPEQMAELRGAHGAAQASPPVMDDATMAAEMAASRKAQAAGHGPARSKEELLAMGPDVEHFDHPEEQRMMLDHYQGIEDAKRARRAAASGAAPEAAPGAAPPSKFREMLGQVPGLAAWLKGGSYSLGASDARAHFEL